jgi:hypothetical protein
LERVERRQKSGIAPCEHEAEVVVADVDCVGVPGFVAEEVQNVDRLEEIEDDHRLGDVA